MRRLVLFLAALALVITFTGALPAIAQDGKVVGNWGCTWEVQGGVHSGKNGTSAIAITSAKGEKLKGSLQLTGLAHDVDGHLTGKIKGTEVTLDRWPLPYGTLTLYLTLNGDAMRGSFSYGNMSNHVVNCERKVN